MTTPINHELVWSQFTELVNIPAKNLEAWLKTPESQKVGYKESKDDESVGHWAGRQIVKILRKKKVELTDEDYVLMRKANGFIRRHLAQTPRSDIEHSRWRYSLMNWGHDPLV